MVITSCGVYPRLTALWDREIVIVFVLQGPHEALNRLSHVDVFHRCSLPCQDTISFEAERGEGGNLWYEGKRRSLSVLDLTVLSLPVLHTVVVTNKADDVLVVKTREQEGR